MAGLLEQALRPLRTRLRNLAARAAMQLCNDAGPVQLVQVVALAGETLDRIQRVQQYGMTSVPLPGAYPAVLLCPSGERAAALAIAVDDVRNRPGGGAPGDVTLYDTRGNQVRLRDGELEIVAVAALSITAAAGAAINVTGNCAITTSGTATVQGATVNVLGTAAVNLGGVGGPAVARVGDAVLVGGVPGTITSGSGKVKAT